MRNLIVSLFVLLVVLTFGCGGGDPPVYNLAPTANAGSNQFVIENSIVTLSGSGVDSDGSIASFSWAQTTGDLVLLSGQSSATPTFVSPIVPTITTLSFELTVTDDDGELASDFVDVVISPNERVVRVPGEYLTISAAIKFAAPGDTVHIATGIHSEINTINIDKDLGEIGHAYT